eukprot:6670076-Pyramimonas_sp.AAC.1
MCWLRTSAARAGGGHAPAAGVASRPEAGKHLHHAGPAHPHRGPRALPADDRPERDLRGQPHVHVARAARPPALRPRGRRLGGTGGSS